MTTLSQTIIRWLFAYGYAKALGRLEPAESRLGKDHQECIDARAALARARGGG